MSKSVTVLVTSPPKNVPRTFTYVSTGQYAGIDKTIAHPVKKQNERFVGFIEKKITTAVQCDQYIETIRRCPQYIVVEAKAEYIYQHTIYEMPYHPVDNPVNARHFPPEAKNKYTAELSLILVEKKTIDLTTVKSFTIEIDGVECAIALPKDISSYNANFHRIHFCTGTVQLPWYLIKPSTKLRLHLYQKYGTVVTAENHPIITFDSDYVANPLDISSAPVIQLYINNNVPCPNNVTISNGVMTLCHKCCIEHCRDKEIAEEIVTRNIAKV
jgi:hypothetical protein